jgi:hypothetical protein
MIRRAQIDETPVADAAAAFGFSRPSFYKARDAFSVIRKAGFTGSRRDARPTPSYTPGARTHARTTGETGESPGQLMAYLLNLL